MFYRRAEFILGNNLNVKTDDLIYEHPIKWWQGSSTEIFYKSSYCMVGEVKRHQ